MKFLQQELYRRKCLPVGGQLPPRDWKNEGVLLSESWPEELTLSLEASEDSWSECPDCGRCDTAAWDEDSEVWRYDINNEGSGIWVRATCLGCGHIELFETTGGTGGTGSVRSLNDIGRKHRDAVVTYEGRVRSGQIEGEYPYILLSGGEE